MSPPLLDNDGMLRCGIDTLDALSDTEVAKGINEGHHRCDSLEVQNGVSVSTIADSRVWG